ncbi:hypothetical protein DFH94DRAFT_715967 [Russula ochroleuca]|uniref:Uncharacterized protein n=1 Tax=Russula ochroleuca TaxID=152965 RepID=A0A9P5N2R4_9AGAM|nr:hypothetical protein DFH94DRAFT_715967 [Russula ochroleuca]
MRVTRTRTMTTISRANSPKQGPSTSDPPSPSQLRNRGAAEPPSSIFVAGGFREAANVSPTLSSFSSGSNALVSAESSLAPHTRKIVIRVDHSIATCFDPADKELYDLWAPKA